MVFFISQITRKWRERSLRTIGWLCISLETLVRRTSSSTRPMLMAMVTWLTQICLWSTATSIWTVKFHSPFYITLSYIQIVEEFPRRRRISTRQSNIWLCTIINDPRPHAMSILVRRFNLNLVDERLKFWNACFPIFLVFSNINHTKSPKIRKLYKVT